jgi:hypothetical protein
VDTTAAVDLPVPRATSLLRLSALAVLTAWIWWDASVSPSRLGSLGSALLALLALGLLTISREIGPLGRARAVLLSTLAAFVVWNFLSMAWADFPAAAWNGANRALVYGVVLALFALWPWSDRDLVLAVRLLALVVGGSALALAVRILASSSPAELIDEGRLALPTGYANGTAALWTAGVLLVLPIAARRATGPWARSLALGSATLLLGLAVLTQSRGWLVTLPIAIALLLLFGRDRLRLVLACALSAVGVLAVLSPLGSVFARYSDGEPEGAAAQRAVAFLLAAAGAVLLLGLVWTWVDRKLEDGSRARRVATVAVAVALIGGVGAGVAVAWRAVDDPGAWIEAKWQDFTTGSSGELSDSRLSGSLATDRYQEWRIAAQEFADHPLLGTGADNYAAAYVLRRDDNRSLPVHPHSTPLRLLSQLGVVGTALFVAVVVSVLVLGFRRRRNADLAASAAVGAGLSVFVYWLVAGSFDVFWETPAFASIALALGGLAAAPRALGTAAADSRERPPRTRAAAAAVAGTVALLAVGLVSLVLTWSSYSFVNSGRAAGASNPQVAYARLDTAATLNPLTALPLVYKALIGIEAGDAGTAQAALRDALDREPDAWFAAGLLGLLEASEGDYESGAALIERAQQLNPRDPLLEIARRLIAAREAVDPALFLDLYLEGLNRESVDWLLERYFSE